MLIKKTPAESECFFVFCSQSKSVNISERIDSFVLVLVRTQIKQVQHRAGDINRRVGADDNAPHNGKRKAAQRIAAEDKQGDRGKQCCQTGQNRTRENVVNTLV